MRFSRTVLAAAGLASLAAPAWAQDEDNEWPVLDNGLTDIVQWCDIELWLLRRHADRGIQGPLQLLRQWRASLHLLWRGMKLYFLTIFKISTKHLLNMRVPIFFT